MKDILKDEIEAIIPIYTKEGGNFTKVKRVGEDLLVAKSVKSVLKDICKFYHYDLKSSNKAYGRMLGIKKTPPIPFTKNLIFIAVKTRKPIGKDDGAFSYVNIEKVEEVKEGTIYFKDGKVLDILSKDKTILKNINLAKLLKEKPTRDPFVLREEELNYNIYTKDILSLKEDLTIIYRKIQQIEKMFLE